MPAKKIAYNQTAAPCKQCGTTNKFSIFQTEDGKTFYSCSKKIGSQYCSGKPSENQEPGGDQTAPQSQAAPTSPSGTFPSPSGSSSSDRELFSKLADAFSDISILFAQLAQE